MNYDKMNLIELHGAWVQNWKAVSTGIQEIIGDMDVPNPREIARLCAEMPEDTWVHMFETENASVDLRKTMDLQKMMAEIQLENIAILNAAMNLGKSNEA